jgi:hypothetical protein
MEFKQFAQRITILFLGILLLGGTSTLYAQDQSRAGTSASPQLQIPLGGQFLDGSGAAAGVTGIASVLWNPAGLDVTDGEILTMVSRREHLADIGVNFAAFGVKFEDIGTFAAHVRSFDIGEIQETNEFSGGESVGTFSPTFFTVGATYGRAMTDQIRVGVTTNVTNESFANISSTSVTFDAGVQYGTFLGFQGLNIGVSVRNIGTSTAYDGSGLLNPASSQGSNRPPTQFKVVTADADIPTTVDLSVEYNVWQGLTVHTTYSENTYKPSELHGQLSYNFRDLITVRGAYTQGLEDRGVLESPYENRPSFGGTLNLASALGVNVSFDYAFVSTQFFDNNHILSLRGSF